MGVRSVTVRCGTVVELRVLERSDDYFAWRNRIQSVLASQLVWKLCTGETAILAEPEQPVTSNSVQEWEDFKWAYEVWERQENKTKLAKSILRSSVSNIIARSLDLREITNPKDILEYLKKDYEPTRPRAIMVALDNMDAVVFRGSTIDFHCQILRARDEIIAAGGTFDDTLILHKLSRGLPEEYQEVITDLVDWAEELPEYEKLLPFLLRHGAAIVKRKESVKGSFT